MNQGDALDVIQAAIWMIIVGAGPAIGAAMVIGIAIALLQALTQIQEMTLTFVPKIVAIFMVVSLTASFIGGQFYVFTENIYAHIEHGFGQ
ncbi:MAG: flagellar biosynthesis protein FliQ [Roseiarcus sp.]|jgi:flagellar biosynthetic protein FliQ